MSKKPSVFEVEILDRMYAEGFKPGNPEFDTAFVARKVTKCQELQQVSSCQLCKYFDHCEMAKAHLINVKYGNKQQAEKATDEQLADNPFGTIPE
jgi:hypothetical protein